MFKLLVNYVGTAVVVLEFDNSTTWCVNIDNVECSVLKPNTAVGIYGQSTSVSSSSNYL